MRKAPLVQGRHRRRQLARSQMVCPGAGFGLGLGGLACLQRDGVRGQGPGRQRSGEAGDDMLMRKVSAQQQDLDQGSGALSLAVDLLGLVPPGVIDRGELAGRAGLFERGGAGKGAGLADQSLQIMVQIQADGALGDQPLVPGPAASTTFGSRPGSRRRPRQRRTPFTAPVARPLPSRGRRGADR